MFVVTEGLKHCPSRSFVSCRFWTEIRGSLRSWWEQGFIQIVVSGRQEMLGSPVMFLPQVSSISQLGGFIRGLQFTCSGGRVSSGSRHHQSALCVFCLRFISRTLVSLFTVVSFGLSCWWNQCLADGFYSHHHLLDTEEPVCSELCVLQVLFSGETSHQPTVQKPKHSSLTLYC